MNSAYVLRDDRLREYFHLFLDLIIFTSPVPIRESPMLTVDHLATPMESGGGLDFFRCNQGLCHRDVLWFNG